MISSAQPVAAHKGMYTPLEELPESTRQLFDYNPEKAKQLLAEAGYPDGFKTKVLCWQSEQVDQLSIFAAYFADIGVDMELDIKEYSETAGIQGDDRVYPCPGLVGKFPHTLRLDHVVAVGQELPR